MALDYAHENAGDLRRETQELRRAIASVIEEFEAATWYQERVDACSDPELKAILAHNRDEEKEHAAMLLEWIRRNDPVQAKELKDYMFTEKPITSIEQDH